MNSRQRHTGTWTRILLGCGAVLWLAGCSTTKRLASDEVLYTGVKKITINTDSSGRIAPGIESAVKDPLSVKPNNPLYSPYVRTPFPIGLWAYNHLYTPKTKGFRHWLYNRLAKNPVLISKVQPELRTKLVADILGNYGYFGSEAQYTLLPRKNPKKAKLSYDIHVGKPWFYDSIAYPRLTGPLGAAFDTLQASSLIRPGAQYNMDTLSAERQRISNILRNAGYYFFRPDYIDYQADTTQRPERVQLRMQVKPTVPEVALRPYTTGSLTVQLQNIRPGIQDTLRLQDYRLIYQKKLKIRPKVLSKAITLDSGKLFTVADQNKTLTNLNKLGIFRSVNLSVTPPDSLHGRDTLDVEIAAAFDYPLEAELEMNVTSKSNSLLGPGLSLRINNNNLFRGGEVLSLRLNGSYEWQTGNRNSGGTKASLLNSYEFGLNASLEFPKLIFPGFFSRVTAYPSRSRIQLGADLLNRPKFFKLISFSTSLSYDWQSSPNSYHSVSILKLTYNQLLHTSAEFDSTLNENPAIALSFRNQFIPAMSYTYTFDKSYPRNRLYWQSSFTSAGNLLYGIMELCGQKGPNKIFNNQFAQFIKATSEVRFYQRIGESASWLAYRFMIGAAHPYANSQVIPYSEQFYIGGANSIRAFTIRSLGPGSYRPPADNKNGYLDQTGTFKLEANVEFRFKMIGKLNGALFVDAGNIWLLKKDKDRPGAELTWRGLGREIALGTGFGLRYDISYLVIRADLGIGIHAPYDTGKHGYYNIPSFKDGLGFHLAIGYPF
ncbi:BamA/TamA family outer membrane protein [Alistipes indistinctus]|jgi:outer membrane protein assembly factor BamA|uniref:translocation and assembly module lipoprotein TamL n=1 Tax=Alistipes indistinctus TaxID=626932 RepID=UPI003BF5B460